MSISSDETDSEGEISAARAIHREEGNRAFLNEPQRARSRPLPPSLPDDRGFAGVTGRADEVKGGTRRGVLGGAEHR